MFVDVLPRESAQPGGSSCDAGCRGFNGPFPLPLWMSHIRLWPAEIGRASSTLRDVASAWPATVPKGDTAHRLSGVCATMGA